MEAAAPLGDVIALKIQELRGQGDEARPLLRIDNRARAAAAPFQFDTAVGRLHRNGCSAIPSSSKTALYGLWHVPPHGPEYACPVCRPADEDESDVDREGPSDYLYGLLSVIDQFGGVIRERGREFRESREGQQLKSGLDGVYRNLDESGRATLDVVLSSLDGLLATLVDIDKSLDGEPTTQANGSANGSRNGNANGNGTNRNGNGNGGRRRKQAKSPNGNRTAAERREPREEQEGR
jgi:hypothetical protein